MRGYTALLAGHRLAVSRANTSIITVLTGCAVVQTSNAPSAQASDDVIAYFSNYPITESSNCTYLLAGARVANAVTLDYDSRPTLAFVFNVRWYSLGLSAESCKLTSTYPHLHTVGSRRSAGGFVYPPLPRVQHFCADHELPGGILDPRPGQLLWRSL